ncbi:MAG: hypothetical protein EAS48_05265 [Chryseobacterium sp.]|nr:MAG: hypothetical protein EAS48_05265 [Chryseobacterium sp.]
MPVVFRLLFSGASARHHDLTTDMPLPAAPEIATKLPIVHAAGRLTFFHFSFKNMYFRVLIYKQLY